jgi:hypothetical protein
LDDIWARWLGTKRTFELFKSMVNEVGSNYGITFTGECDKSVVFLDVTTMNTFEGLHTTMYVKPTDSVRYLHRRSGHSQHVFTGIPFSQYRRAVVICSAEESKLECIARMQQKFIDSGYKDDDLQKAKNKALQISRASVLDGVDENPPRNGTSDVMACVVYQHPTLRKELNKFFCEFGDQLRTLVGDVRFVVSERKHPNIAALLFAKGSFSQVKSTVKSNQKCQKSRCSLCVSMTLPKKTIVNGFLVKMDFRCNCLTEHAIYLARCKNCMTPAELATNFYFGRTLNTVRTRCNGHRSKFKLSEYDKSALSYHTYDKHVDKFTDKLLNYDIGVVKTSSPSSLERLEDYYIYETKADVYGLNRYKVAK